MKTERFSLFKLLTIFAIAFSLAALGGPLSGHFQLPSIQAVRAVPQSPCHVTLPGGGCSDYWVPAGTAEDTLRAVIFTDEQAEFTDLQSASPSIDFTDTPLTPPLPTQLMLSPNFQVTSTINEAGYYEIQFLLANNFWGCNFNFGNSTCGVEIRQGMAHMIDTASFAANQPSIAGQAAALDAPVPTDNVGNLPTSNPCAWDKSFPQTGTNCIVGAPGGTAYHLGSAAGAGGFAWNQAPGSKDLNAAAQHFVNAGIATGFNPTTSILTGISSGVLAHVPNLFRVSDSQARLDLGTSLAEQICYLFTGSPTIPCAYLSVGTGAPLQAFPGYVTSTTSVSLSWGIFPAAYSYPKGPQPFDASLYFQYNSKFVSGIPSIQSPSGLCSQSSTPTANAPNYIYLCNPLYDSLSNQMESASCLTIAGDPIVGSTSNNSTGTCSAGGLSSIGAGVQAENQFGRNAFTIPVFERSDQFAILNNGWIRVVNNIGSGLPNYFTWLSTWNPSPVVPGTIRQGFKSTTGSVSPFLLRQRWDQYIAGDIYDSLIVQNPLSGSQLIDWAALGQQQLPNSSLTYLPPQGTIQSFRFTLRNDLFFQDGTKVTAFDVAFSYLALKGAGALAGAGAAPMTGVTVLGPSQFDIHVNAVGPFTLQYLASLPILPGAYWTNAGASAWRSSVASCTQTTSCYPAQYTIGSPTTTTACALTCIFPAANMNVNVAQTSASYDPLANHTLVGSGPLECGPVTSGGSSTSCSSTGAQNPPVGGTYTLTRFGQGLAPGSSISGDYFRSNGNLALWIWSEENGQGHDFLTFTVLAACFGMPVTTSGACAHFQQGIGANGGPVPVGLSQISIVARFFGVNWVAPFDLASPPFGIIPLIPNPPVLYEGTTLLNPASVVGCPAGYDC